MAGAALALAEEDVLPTQLGGTRLRWIELAEHVQLRCRREIQKRLEFPHEVNLTATLQHVDAFLGSNHWITVEIGSTLLELGEILDRLQRPLRPEQPLDIDAAQGRRVDAMAELLRTDVTHQMRCRIGMSVGMAVQATPRLAFSDRRSSV